MTNPISEETNAFFIASESGVDPETCEHKDTHLIGADGGNNDYYSCGDCNGIIVVPGPEAPEPRTENDIDDSGPTHPLLKGLTPDPDPYAPPEHRNAKKSPIERFIDIFR